MNTFLKSIVVAILIAAASGPSIADDDFWGAPTGRVGAKSSTPTSEPTNKKTPANDDFWGAPTGRVGAKSSTPTSEPTNKAKPASDDFWGAPSQKTGSSTKGGQPGENKDFWSSTGQTTLDNYMLKREAARRLEEEQRRKAEEERIAEEKRKREEQERLAKQRKEEEERLAKLKKEEEERIQAEKEEIARLEEERREQLRREDRAERAAQKSQSNADLFLHMVNTFNQGMRETNAMLQENQRQLDDTIARAREAQEREDQIAARKAEIERREELVAAMNRCSGKGGYWDSANNRCVIVVEGEEQKRNREARERQEAKIAELKSTCQKYNGEWVPSTNTCLRGFYGKDKKYEIGNPGRVYTGPNGYISSDPGDGWAGMRVKTGESANGTGSGSGSSFGGAENGASHDTGTSKRFVVNNGDQSCSRGITQVEAECIDMNKKNLSIESCGEAQAVDLDETGRRRQEWRDNGRNGDMPAEVIKNPDGVPGSVWRKCVIEAEHRYKEQESQCLETGYRDLVTAGICSSKILNDIPHPEKTGHY